MNAKLLTKSELAFESWYIPLRNDPMPSQIWDAAIEWAVKYLSEHMNRPESRSVTQWEPFVYEMYVKELTK